MFMSCLWLPAYVQVSYRAHAFETLSDVEKSIRRSGCQDHDEAAFPAGVLLGVHTNKLVDNGTATPAATTTTAATATVKNSGILDRSGGGSGINRARTPCTHLVVKGQDEIHGIKAVRTYFLADAESPAAAAGVLARDVTEENRYKMMALGGFNEEESKVALDEEEESDDSEAERDGEARGADPRAVPDGEATELGVEASVPGSVRKSKRVSPAVLGEHVRMLVSVYAAVSMTVRQVVESFGAEAPTTSSQAGLAPSSTFCLPSSSAASASASAASSSFRPVFMCADVLALLESNLHAAASTDVVEQLMRNAAYSMSAVDAYGRSYTIVQSKPKATSNAKSDADTHADSTSAASAFPPSFRSLVFACISVGHIPSITTSITGKQVPSGFDLGAVSYGDTFLFNRVDLDGRRAKAGEAATDVIARVGGLLANLSTTLTLTSAVPPLRVWSSNGWQALQNKKLVSALDWVIRRGRRTEKLAAIPLGLILYDSVIKIGALDEAGSRGYGEGVERGGMVGHGEVTAGAGGLFGGAGVLADTVLTSSAVLPVLRCRVTIFSRGLVIHPSGVGLRGPPLVISLDSGRVRQMVRALRK